jgi:uncharacterized membrane protein
MGDLGGFLLGLAGLIIIVLVALWVVYSLFTLDRSKRQPSAEDIVNERYARGEISEEEYRKKLSDLSTDQR